MDKLISRPAGSRVVFKKMFTLSVSKSEEQAQIAGILTIILWAVIVVVSGLILMWWFAGIAEELGPYAFVANTIIVGVALSLLILVRRGHLSLAARSCRTVRVHEFSAA